MNKLTRGSAIAALIVLALAVLAGCPKKEEEGAGGGGMGGGMSGPPPVSVIVQPVELRDYAPAIELVGEIRAKQRVTLASEVAGKVLSVSSRVGDKHAQGSGTLIQIDPATYQAQLDGASASLRQAKEDLARIESGARPNEVRSQEAVVEAALATYEQALDNYERQRQLYEEGVIAESALVGAQKQAEASEAAWQAQLEVLENLRAGSRSEDIEAAKARVQLQESMVEASSLALSRTSVKVPFDAIVTMLFVEEGQYVGPGTPLVEVIASGPQEAWFNLPEEAVARFGPGSVVELRSDSLPDEMFEATVIAVSPSADPATRQFPLRAEVVDERLLPGMAVRGRVLTADIQPTLMVSQDAAYESKLGLVVYRMTPPGPNDEPPMEGMPPLPSFESVNVELGERIDGLVVVLKGDLKAGDMLVTRGKESLYPTAKIIPTNLQGGEGAPPGDAPPGAPDSGSADSAAEGAEAPAAEAGEAAGAADAEGQEGTK